MTPQGVPALQQDVASWLGAPLQEQTFTAAYVACIEMIRYVIWRHSRPFST